MKTKQIILMALLGMVAMFAAASRAEAKWLPAGDLSQAIPLQDTTKCKFRLTWLVSSPYPGEPTFYLSLAQTKFIEARLPGAPRPGTQGIIFSFDEDTAHQVWAYDAQGQILFQAVDALLSGDATARLQGMSIVVRTYSPYTNDAYVQYRDQAHPNGGVLQFHFADPSLFKLERECVD